MQSQAPFLDAMLNMPVHHPSHHPRQPQLSNNGFGYLPTSVGPTSSSSLHDIESMRYASLPRTSTSSPHYQNPSSTVGWSDYDMMQLLSPVSSGPTCRCGGSMPQVHFPNHHHHHPGPSMGGSLDLHRSQYGSIPTSQMGPTAVSHPRVSPQHLGYSIDSAPLKDKHVSKDASCFMPEFQSVCDIPFDELDSWSDMNTELITSMTQLIPPAELSTFIPSPPYYDSSSPDNSPSPSASPKSDHVEYFNPFDPSRDPRRSDNSPLNKQPPVKQCSHCRATSTPLWRREPTTLKPLCNACGLYLQQRNKLRPQELIDADDDDDTPPDTPGDMSGPECSHCHTRQTSVWRRSKTGAQLCNACGVYSRLRGKDRPLSLKRNKIKPRSKHPSK